MHRIKHRVVPLTKVWQGLFHSLTAGSAHNRENNSHQLTIVITHRDTNDERHECCNRYVNPLPRIQDDDSFSIFLLTFSANHSHCKRSAIKHWPAGDKGPSHLAGAAPYVTSRPYNQPVMALLPCTSPSYLPASQPRSGKTTCRNNDKTIRGIVLW